MSVENKEEAKFYRVAENGYLIPITEEEMIYYMEKVQLASKLAK